MATSLRYVALVTLLGIISAALIVGCQGTPAAAPAKQSPTASASKPASSVATKEPYKVGVIQSVTGFNAALGVPGRDAMVLLAEQINAKGGINGHPLQLIVLDDGSDETKAATATRKLVEEDKVLGIIGTNGSGATLAMETYIKEVGLPHVVTSSIDQTIVNSPVWSFKVLGPQQDNSEVNLAYAQKQGVKKLGIIHDNLAFGTSQKDTFAAVGKRLGMEVASESFGPEDKDMTTQLTKLKGWGMEALNIIGTGPTAVIILRNLDQLGMRASAMKPIVFVTYSAAQPQYMQQLGPLGEGLIIITYRFQVVDDLPDSEPTKPVILAFTKAFKQKYGQDKQAEHFVGIHHDGLAIMVKALEMADPDTSPAKLQEARKKIRDSMESIKNLVGFHATYSFSPEKHMGHVLGDNLIVIYRNGKFTLLK